MTQATGRFGHLKADAKWAAALAVMAWQRRVTVPRK